MFKWLFFFLIFATSGIYQNKEKPLKRQRRLGLRLTQPKGKPSLYYSSSDEERYIFGAYIHCSFSKSKFLNYIITHHSVKYEDISRI